VISGQMGLLADLQAQASSAGAEAPELADAGVAV
jgi:hypothetical protein